MTVALRIFLYGTLSALVTSCTHHNNQKDPIEVYQITHLVNVSTPEGNTTLEVDLLRDSLVLPSRTSCKYSDGKCYDGYTDVEYTWDVSGDFRQAGPSCDNLKRFYVSLQDLNYTFGIFPSKKDRSVKYLVGEGSKSFYLLQLMREETFCGRKVWRTGVGDLIVSVGEENLFRSASDEPQLLDKPVDVTYYPIALKNNVYSMLQCDYTNEDSKDIVSYGDEGGTNFATRSELEGYKDEIVQLKDTIATLQRELEVKDSEFLNLQQDVYDIKTTIQDMHRKLIKFRKENAHLKDRVSILQNGMSVMEEINEAELLPRDSEIDDPFQKKEVPRTSASILDRLRNCPNFVLFPFEDVFCVAAAVLYVAFSVINTITNYFSLRMLRNKKQGCFVFYTLTQGLTTSYVCRSLDLTKKRIDKWLLDLE